MEDDLPVDGDFEGDSDLEEVDAVPGVPVHRRPGLAGLVFLGGVAGTGTRYVISRAVPHVGQVPLAVLVVNVGGAFVLGLIVALLARRGPDVGRRRGLRLLLGTGFCGGFTTYSALAVDTVTLVQHGLSGRAVAYALTTVLVGGLATLAGLAVARGPATAVRSAS